MTKMSNYPEKCHVAGCPCHEWSAKSPSESPTTPSKDARFLVPEAENVPQGDSEAGNGILAPTFTEEWESAPRWATRTTEVESAEYWFLRGVRAGEAGAMVTMNEDLREIRRVAAERIEQR